jgi:hypothetical protein
MIVVGLAAAGAARQGVRATADLTWPPGSDFSRDVAGAETIASGHPLADPFYRAEWIWYNPLVPALVVVLANTTHQEIPLVYARAGAYLNLLGPLALFVLLAYALDAPISATVVIAFLFVIPGREPAWTYATYSPWLLPVQFTQGIFYISLLALAWATQKKTVTSFALAGLGMGLTFLGHTAPALVLGATALVGAVDAGRFRSARWVRLFLIYLIFAALVASPFLVSIVGHYHLQVRNPAPSAWVYAPLELSRASTFWRAFFTLSAVGIVSLVGWVRLVSLCARAAVRTLMTSAAVCCLWLAFDYLVQATRAYGYSLPSIVPGFHFLFYLGVYEALGFGVGLATIVMLVWRASASRWTALRERQYVVPPILTIALVGLVAASRYQAYGTRPDFVEERQSAQRMFADPALREMLRWLRGTPSPSDVVLAGDSLGLSVVGPAGRKVVAVDRLFSNPYVDWSERARDRDEMLRLLAQWTDGDEPRFSSLAVKYRVRYVAVPTDLVAPGFASTQRPLVWRSGVWSIYQIGA